MKASFELIRETENYFLYEAQEPKSGDIISVYLEKHANVGDGCMQIIVCRRAVHQCNCKFCRYEANRTQTEIERGL